MKIMQIFGWSSCTTSKLVLTILLKQIGGMKIGSGYLDLLPTWKANLFRFQHFVRGKLAVKLPGKLWFHTLKKNPKWVSQAGGFIVTWKRNPKLCSCWLKVKRMTSQLELFDEFWSIWSKGCPCFIHDTWVASTGRQDINHVGTICFPLRLDKKYWEGPYEVCFIIDPSRTFVFDEIISWGNLIKDLTKMYTSMPKSLSPVILTFFALWSEKVRAPTKLATHCHITW